MTAAIRPATDADALAALRARCFAEPWDMAATLAAPGTFALVDGARGFIVCRCAIDECEILAVGVAPEARRGGLGTALVAAAIDTARARGVARMFLEVAESNTAARVLYARAGFAPVGRRRGYYGGGVDAIVLARAL